MDVFTLIGIITVLYFVVYCLALLLLDCDLQLAWSEKFGRPIDVLKDNVVWITGASSGIGEHIALVLAEQGVRLVLSSRRKSELQRVKRKCLGMDWYTMENVVSFSNGFLLYNSQIFVTEMGKYLNPDDIMVLDFDITNLSVHEEMFDKVIEYFGTLDVLINNAGRSQRAEWEKIKLSVDKEMFDLNVFSIISLSRIATRYFLKQQKRGHIVVTSSVTGVFPLSFSATYNATKHALHGYFNTLCAEKLGTNIHTTLLCPGPTFSNFLSECFMDDTGKKYGKSVRPNDRRMTGERCGKLCAIAIANCQKEAWMGIFPFMPLFHLIYYPNLTRIVQFLGANYIIKMRDSG